MARVASSHALRPRRHQSRLFRLLHYILLAHSCLRWDSFPDHPRQANAGTHTTLLRVRCDSLASPRKTNNEQPLRLSRPIARQHARSISPPTRKPQPRVIPPPLRALWHINCRHTFRTRTERKIQLRCMHGEQRHQVVLAPATDTRP